MKLAFVNLSLWLLVVSLGAFACRGADPSGDPRTPPNSPIPQVDRPEEPKAPLPNPLSDGGAAAQSSGSKP